MKSDIKILIAFMVVFVALIAGIAFWETSLENERTTAPERNTSSEEKAELIKPTKYQDIGTNYPIATITMQDGRAIEIELYPNIAPTTVENFISLANSGYYDGLTFHRAVEGFIVQGGDPEANGQGGPGYSIVGEFYNNGYENELTHDVGVISMARESLDLNSAGSQFFIVTGENAKLSLDGAYAGFGKVIEGMDTIYEIEKLEVKDEQSGEIVNKPIIKSITVDTKGVSYSEPEKIEK